ncbi:MAG: RluA family pseudouridine synthase [Planctomycetes bacterium]|nr:RluA family pseudouridine synthase [Planctomycetota bacterium]
MEIPADILFEDDAILAVNKPAGYETVVKGTKGSCLTSALRRGLRYDFLQPAHRLDRDTTGVQLFGKSADVLEKLEKIFREREVNKLYLALCLGIPRNQSGSINRNLSKWKGGRCPVQVVKGKDGLAAETFYEIIAKGGLDMDNSASLILFKPKQGRTHQVRVHASAFGYPLVGDDNYGKREANKIAKQNSDLDRYALHAWRTSIPHPTRDYTVSIEAPMAPDMEKALDTFMLDWREKLDAYSQSTKG